MVPILVFPGTSPVAEQEEEAFDLQQLLSLAESGLCDTALALALFQEAEHRRPPANDDRFQDALHRQETRARRRERSTAEILAEFGEPEHDLASHAAFDLRIMKRDVEILVRERPALELLASRRRDLFAHAFLMALDGVRKSITQASKLPTAKVAAEATVVRMEAAAPALVAVRDSAVHAEERVRRLAWGRPINAKAVDEPAIKAEADGVMVLGMLHGNVLRYTSARGEIVGVEISSATLSACTDAVQSLIDALRWWGPARVTIYRDQ